MQKYFLFYHTIKHLKPVQFSNRILRKFKKIKFSEPYIECRQVSRSWNIIPVLPSCYENDGNFRFLNVTEAIGNWNDETKSKLWLYNLHYFDDLNRSGWKSRAEIHVKLIDTWVEQNPPMVGNGWEPYTLSLRIVNWIKWFLAGNLSKSSWLASLSLQIQALEQSLEYHLLGNHLFANAKALIFAGCYFGGGDGEAWLKKGLEILEKEIPEQILNDGGNFELTPMYHNTVLTDMLDLYQLSLVYPELICSKTRAYWLEYIVKMLSWAELMEHPDGDVSFFNDSAIGIAPQLSMLKKYASALGVETPSYAPNRVAYLKDSGYIVANTHQKKLIIDVAKVGPDYIPGHAHADTLSFELSIGKQRLFVNSGTSIYGSSVERLRQRKTESHNTVVVDSKDSSEVWGGFRVARRAYTSTPDIRDDGQVVSVICSHNGYMRLPGKVTHTREWQLDSDSLVIVDTLEGDFNAAQAHYHLHPDIELLNESDLIFRLADGSIYSVSVKGAEVKLVESTWHPQFGMSVPNKKLVVNFKRSEVVFVLKRVI